MRDLTPMCAGSRIFSRRKNVGLKTEFSRTGLTMQRKSANLKSRIIVTFTSLFPAFTRFGQTRLSRIVRLLLVSAKLAFRALSDFYSFPPNSPFAHCQTFTRFRQTRPFSCVRLSLVLTRPAFACNPGRHCACAPSATARCTADCCVPALCMIRYQQNQTTARSERRSGR